MADLSPAEIMLDSLVPAQRLIRRLQDILKAPIPYTGIDLPQHAKAKIAALQGSLQTRIDELTARTVIELRYGLIGSGYELMPYPEVGETLNYADKTILQYRKRGVDQLNQILEGQ